MKIAKLNSLMVAIAALSLTPSAFATYQNSQYEALARSVQQSLKANPSQASSFFIEEINSGFALLPRTEAPIEDLREMKFLLQYWRMRTSKKLVKSLQQITDSAQYTTALLELSDLRITLPVQTLVSLTRHPALAHSALAQDALLHLLVTQGQGELLDGFLDLTQTQNKISPYQSALAGPRASVPIFPLEPSQYPFQVWAKNKEFSNYAYPDPSSKNTFQYRGMTLQSGDFILMNENDPTDADFTSLGKDRAYVSHFGIVAILEKNGRRFPVGIEMHTNGLRAVPLSRFISRDFAAYVEIYRLRGMNEAWRDQINAIGAQELTHPKGYDFQSQDANRRYLNCVTVGSMFLERSGVAPIDARTIVREKIRDDFQKLGLLYDHLLTPTDVSRSPRVQFVGAIDQNLYAELLAKDLTAGELVEIFNEGTVDFKKAPPMYYLLRFGVDQLQRGTFIGNWILKWKKMDAVNLPNAPAQLLSWVVPFETRYRQLVKEAMPLLMPRILELPPSLQAIQSDSKIRSILKNHSDQLRALFSK